MRQGRIKRRNRKLYTKKACVTKHCTNRCIERLGYVPNLKELAELIQDNGMIFYDRQSYRVTRWKWTDPVNGINCILPYDSVRKQVITVLFEDLELLKKGEMNESKIITNDAKPN